MSNWRCDACKDDNGPKTCFLTVWDSNPYVCPYNYECNWQPNEPCSTCQQFEGKPVTPERICENCGRIECWSIDGQRHGAVTGWECGSWEPIKAKPSPKFKVGDVVYGMLMDGVIHGKITTIMGLDALIKLIKPVAYQQVVPLRLCYPTAAEAFAALERGGE